jgi:predicted Rdx family selenoprotein
VRADGALIFSKKTEGRFPHAADILGKLRVHPQRDHKS